MTTEPAEVITGDTVFLTIDVANLGTALAGVTMLVTLPPTMESRSFNAPGQAWECVFHAPSWTCSTGLAPGQVAEPLHLNAGVVGGTPGDVLTVTAQATTSRERSTTNNSGQASINLVQAGIIRGTVWVDGNAGPLDGQRQPEEPGFPMPLGGTLRVHNEDGTTVLPDVTVNDDGSYSYAVKPGRYYVEAGVSVFFFGFTTPNVGDDATDSDVIPLPPGDFDTAARSEVFDVTGGSQTVIDVGVIELGGP